MDPITILGAAGSAIGIAGFGIQLAQVLSQYVSEVNSAAPALQAVLENIESASHAMTQIHGFLEIEYANVGKGRNADLFSPDAINNIQKTTDKCLVVFWRVEAFVTDKDDSPELEVILSDRLERFKTQLKAAPKSPVPILELDKPFAKARKLSVRDRLFWPLQVPKLEQFTNRLHRLQASLTLMFQILTMRALQRKPGIGNVEMQTINHIYAMVPQIAADAQIYGMQEEYYMRTRAYPGHSKPSVLRDRGFQDKKATRYPKNSPTNRQDDVGSATAHKLPPRTVPRERSESRDSQKRQPQESDAASKKHPQALHNALKYIAASRGKVKGDSTNEQMPTGDSHMPGHLGPTAQQNGGTGSAAVTDHEISSVVAQKSTMSAENDETRTIQRKRMPEMSETHRMDSSLGREDNEHLPSSNVEQRNPPTPRISINDPPDLSSHVEFVAQKNTSRSSSLAFTWEFPDQTSEIYPGPGENDGDSVDTDRFTTAEKLGRPILQPSKTPVNYMEEIRRVSEGRGAPEHTTTVQTVEDDLRDEKIITAANDKIEQQEVLPDEALHSKKNESEVPSSKQPSSLVAVKQPSSPQPGTVIPGDNTTVMISTLENSRKFSFPYTTLKSRLRKLFFRDHLTPLDLRLMFAPGSFIAAFLIKDRNQHAIPCPSHFRLRRSQISAIISEGRGADWWEEFCFLDEDEIFGVTQIMTDREGFRKILVQLKQIRKVQSYWRLLTRKALVAIVINEPTGQSEDLMTPPPPQLQPSSSLQRIADLTDENATDVAMTLRYEAYSICPRHVTGRDRNLQWASAQIEWQNHDEAATMQKIKDLEEMGPSVTEKMATLQIPQRKQVEITVDAANDGAVSIWWTLAQVDILYHDLPHGKSVRSITVYLVGRPVNAFPADRLNSTSEPDIVPQERTPKLHLRKKSTVAFNETDSQIRARIRREKESQQSGRNSEAINTNSDDYDETFYTNSSRDGSSAYDDSDRHSLSTILSSEYETRHRDSNYYPKREKNAPRRDRTRSPPREDEPRASRRTYEADDRPSRPNREIISPRRDRSYSPSWEEHFRGSRREYQSEDRSRRQNSERNPPRRERTRSPPLEERSRESRRPYQDPDWSSQRISDRNPPQRNRPRSPPLEENARAHSRRSQIEDWFGRLDNEKKPPRRDRTRSPPLEERSRVSRRPNHADDRSNRPNNETATSHDRRPHSDNVRIETASSSHNHSSNLPRPATSRQAIPDQRSQFAYPEYYDGRSFDPYSLPDESEIGKSIVRQLLLKWTPAGEEEMAAQALRNKEGMEGDSFGGAPSLPFDHPYYRRQIEWDWNRSPEHERREEYPRHPRSEHRDRMRKSSRSRRVSSRDPSAARSKSQRERERFSASRERSYSNDREHWGIVVHQAPDPPSDSEAEEGGISPVYLPDEEYLKDQFLPEESSAATANEERKNDLQTPFASPKKEHVKKRDKHNYQAPGPSSDSDPEERLTRPIHLSEEPFSFAQFLPEDNSVASADERIKDDLQLPFASPQITPDGNPETRFTIIQEADLPHEAPELSENTWDKLPSAKKQRSATAEPSLSPLVRNPWGEEGIFAEPSADISAELPRDTQRETEGREKVVGKPMYVEDESEDLVIPMLGTRRSATTTF